MIKDALNHEAHQTIKAAEVLRAQIEGLAGDDIQLIQDTMEGQTELHEIIRALMAGIGEDTAHIAGVKKYVEGLQSRIARLEERVTLRRGLIQTGLELAEQKSLEADIATVSLGQKPQQAIIAEEADIPAEFWKPQPPKLDKRAILDALKAETPVAGATLDNGGTTLAIRWR